MMKQLSRTMLRQIGHFELRIMQTTDFEQVVEIASNQFPNNDPLSIGAKYTQNTFETFFRNIKQRVLAQNMSLVAIDTRNNSVAGSLIVEDYNLADDASATPENIQNVLNWLHRIRTKLQVEGIVSTELNVVQHSFFASINPKYKGQGVMRQLFELNELHARMLGYAQIIGECSSPITYHLCRTQGYECVDFYPYSELTKTLPSFTMDSRINSMYRGNEVPGLRMMLKSLDEQQQYIQNKATLLI